MLCALHNNTQSFTLDCCALWSLTFPSPRRSSNSLHHEARRKRTRGGRGRTRIGGVGREGQGRGGHGHEGRRGGGVGQELGKEEEDEGEERGQG